MRILASTLNMTQDDWHKHRTFGIGGSDAGAICGMNPWMTAIDVYLDKIGEAKPREVTEAMRLGTDLEEYVASRFTEETGKKVRRKNAIIQHDEYDWMIANVDRMIIGEDALLECKTASPYSSGRWKDGIPESYEIQCHHYMAVTGAQKCYLACLILGQQLIIRKIDRDEEMVQMLIKIEKDFWEQYVVQKQLPPPDGSKASEDAIKAIYKDTNPDLVVELIDFEDKIKRMDEINELLSVLEPEKEQIKQEIMVAMGEAETSFIGERKFTWKQQAGRTTVQSKELKNDHPDIYEKYSKTGAPFRVFKAI